MALLISALVSLPQSIGRSSSAIGMSGVFALAGLLRSPSKCPIKRRSFLSLTRRSVRPSFSVSFFVMS